jgi:hypothetical protein
VELGDRHEDWDDAPIRCVACGGWFDPDETILVRTWRGPVCAHCDDNGETEIVARPLAGRHVSRCRRILLGALGFTSTYRKSPIEGASTIPEESSVSDRLDRVGAPA